MPWNVAKIPFSNHQTSQAIKVVIINDSIPNSIKRHRHYQMTVNQTKISHNVPKKIQSKCVPTFNKWLKLTEDYTSLINKRQILVICTCVKISEFGFIYILNYFPYWLFYYLKWHHMCTMYGLITKAQESNSSTCWWQILQRLIDRYPVPEV